MRFARCQNRAIDVGCPIGAHSQSISRFFLTTREAQSTDNRQRAQRNLFDTKFPRR